jgi:hypothetical protein
MQMESRCEIRAASNIHASAFALKTKKAPPREGGGAFASQPKT